MAININTVYSKVLTLSNKEQRGYITPQEFNLLADKAQMEIFQEYFYDEDKAVRMPSNDRKLMNVPFDEHPYSALAAWFKTDEGMEIYSNIEKRLK